MLKERRPPCSTKLRVKSGGVLTPEAAAFLLTMKARERARLAEEEEQDSKCNSIATAAEVRVKG